MRRRNAIIVLTPEHLDERDFRAIAKRAMVQAPDVKVYLAIKGRRNRTARWVQLLRPTLRVEIEPVEGFAHLRGHRLHCGVEAGAGKLETLARLQTAGLPVPDFVEVTPGLILDPAVWGPYVVVKPSIGRRGANVTLKRTEKVRFRAPEDYPEDHFGRRGPMLAQRFVYTGPWPVVYRVLSFLGRPLHSIRYESPRTQPAIETPDAISGASIVAASRRSTISVPDEPDLLLLAERIHAALPEHPVIGADIVRDGNSGALSVIEVNHRYCWTLSNESGRQMQAQFGLDFYTQYGALDLAAEALVAATRRLAR